MKKLIILLAMLPAVLLFYGCPVGLDHSAGTPGTEKIDKALIGTWVTDKAEHEFKKVTITKIDDFSYKLVVEEKGEMYAVEGDEFTGWITTIKGQKFLYAKPTVEDKYYLYHYEVDGKKLITHDVSLLDGGVDAVKSTETLRKQIETSLDMEDCLSEETTFTKQ
ncbi:MAG: hypothetical protein ACO1PI_09130 [Bacteroidota bacterium]